MRRIFSISIALALIASAYAPAVMPAHATGRMYCHLAPHPTSHEAVKTHHCDSMADMAENNADANSSGELALSSTPERCPMDCCSLAGSIAYAAAVSPAGLSVQITANRTTEYSSIIFAGAGFSSHTDRGPPSA